jgi:hypothetical protein
MPVSDGEVDSLSIAEDVSQHSGSINSEDEEESDDPISKGKVTSHSHTKSSH